MNTFKEAIMRIATTFNEDLADFATTALVCAKCSHETRVVGPVSKKATCGRCGSKKLIKRTVHDATASNNRSAA